MTLNGRRRVFYVYGTVSGRGRIRYSYIRAHTHTRAFIRNAMYEWYARVSCRRGAVNDFSACAKQRARATSRRNLSAADFLSVRDDDVFSPVRKRRVYLFSTGYSLWVVRKRRRRNFRIT